MRRLSAMVRIGAVLMFVVMLSAGAAFGQQVTGTILGRVTDSTGGVVPDATIQIQNAATGFSRIGQADADGRYLESNLPLGTYTVTVQKQGFQTLVRSGIELTVGSQVTVNAELVVGNIQQHVEVTGEAPAIETSNATISGFVSQDQLRDLPLNGRSIDQLALLSPGIFANHATAQNATVGLGTHLTVDGARQDWNLYLLDGTVINDVQSGRSSAAGEALGVEGILEFRILTHGASAEYGRTAGGVISEVTRSGTNQLHGSAYEFVRNTIFNSQNVFANGIVPPFHRNQFGAAVGGPILKNKLFFFVNYEGLRARQAFPVISFVPDANARMGILPSGPDPTFNPIMTKYLNLYPPVNVAGSDSGGIGESNNNYSQPTTENYTMARLDYKISDKDSFFGRFVYDPSDTTLALATTTFVSTQGGDDRFLALGETHIFSPSTLNEFRFAVNLTRPTQISGPTIPIDPSLSYVPGQTLGLITFSSSVGSTSLSELGPNDKAPQIFEQNLITESDTVTKVKGAHSIKFGVEVEREQINAYACSACTGSFQFGGLTSLLAAQPSNYVEQVIGPSAAGIFSNPERGWRRILFGAFVQDDYRVRPNLTLNLGLRYEFLTSPSEANGMSSSLINVTDPKNTPGPPFLAPKLNFAPRVGLAWDPTGSGKTSIRLGGGVYDNQLDGRAWFANAGLTADYVTRYKILNPPFPNGLGGSITVPKQTNSRVQYYSKEPIVYEWNLEVQRQLAPTLSLRVGYVGSRGVHLPAPIEANTKVPTFDSMGNISYSPSAPFTNPTFASMATTVTAATSNYNAMQVLLQKTASAGLTFQASYTYSHAQSEADQIVSGQTTSGPGSVMNPYNFAQDYSNSAFDQRHTLVVNGAYQMPWDHLLNSGVAKAALGGWAINGIFSYGSGLPFDILSGFNNSLDGNSNNPDRPNLVAGYSSNPNSGVTQGNAINPNCTALGGPKAGLPLHTVAHWFDPCAFKLNTAGTYGNLVRNSVTGPGLSTVDLSLVKLTNITERTKLEFRAECFNLFNHPNFGVPSNSVFSSDGTYAGNAGTITTTSVDNRELQFGLKLIF